MTIGDEELAGQDTETYDAVVEDLNFDPKSPGKPPHPDHPGPGAASHGDETEDNGPDHPGQHQGR